jgi:hypothetical protein
LSAASETAVRQPGSLVLSQPMSFDEMLAVLREAEQTLNQP